MKFSIILPCYNEEESLPKVLPLLPKEAFEVIVVDNNSSDNTSKIAKELGAKVVLEKTQGYGAAIRRGFKEAKGDVLVVIDGDGQYPAEKIVEMVVLLEKEKIDFISGSRFPMDDKKSLPLVRRVGNWLFTFATNVLFGIGIKDSQSGMWVFKKEVLEKITLVSNNMALSEEIKVKAADHPNIAFREYHIPYYERVGESKLFPLKHGILNLLFLLQLRLELWKMKFTRDTFFFLGGLFVVLFAYLLLSFQHIRDPFIHVTADVNGQNGMAAINLVHHGFWKLKFGVFDKLLLNPDDAWGAFYTHHPSFFILPTAILYQFLGVSELTTRLGPLLLMVFGIICFGAALRKLFNDTWTSLAILLTFSVLPGVVFYGKAFELAVFALPCALITFSFFVFSLTSPKKIYSYLFLLSIVMGGFMSWFYYFLPASLWLLLLVSPQFKKNTQRTFFLWLIPATMALVFIANFFHFYILNKLTPFDLVQAFEYRAGRQPFGPWMQRIWSMLTLQATSLFLFTAACGCIAWWVSLRKKMVYSHLLLAFVLMPLGVALVFSQWSTHPFGVIYWFPAVAISTGVFLVAIIRKFSWAGAIIATIIFLFALNQSYKNLDFFYKEFRILGERDIQLIKELKPIVNNNEVCLGVNPMGIGFMGIADWYIEKKTNTAPGCIEDPRTTIGIVFNPQFSKEFLTEALTFEKEGFVMRGCAEQWCIMDKGNILGIGKK